MARNRKLIIMTLVLCAVTAAVYYRAAFFPFCVMDDNDYAIGNAYIREGWSLNSIKWAFTTLHASNWHPLTWLSLLTDSQLFGMNPMGFHVVNVLFHILSSALLFLLFHYMTGAFWRSALVAALFALHPLHVESVAWISERKDVLSAFFLTLTLLLYTGYLKGGRRRVYFAALAVFALGLMAKPMLVTLPALLLLLDYWPFLRSGSAPLAGAELSGAKGLNAVSTGKLLVEKVPFLALAAISSIVTIYAQQSGDAVAPLKSIPLLERIANSLQSYLLYAGDLLLPHDLAIFYQFAPVSAWKAGGALLLLSGALFLAFRKRSSFPYLLTGLLWYLVMLLPVIGLIQVGAQARADRYSYLPSIGLFVIASWGGADLAARFPKLRGAAIGAALASVLLCAIGSSLQLTYWKSNVTLFSHALAVTQEESCLARARMGLAYDAEGRPDLAVGEYQEALKIDPETSSVHLRLGIALGRLGRMEEAVDHFRAELRVRPRLPEAHYDLALALHKIGRVPQAISQYKEALALEPDDTSCHDNLGLALLQQGNFDEAIQHFNEELRLNPGLTQASSNLQFALSQKSRSAR